MYKVNSIMAGPVITIEPEASVMQAAEVMKAKRLGSLVVIEGGKLVGILTSRDVRYNHFNRLVADAMSKQVISCTPHNTVWDAIKLMEKHKIEHLPVLDKEEVVGIITKVQVVQYKSKLLDPLTNLFCSEYLYQIGNDLLSNNYEICAIMLDVDNFGYVNKKYGHVYGDECLKKISSLLRESINEKSDYLCRYGGDEFVILTKRDVADAEMLVENIMDLIARRGVPGNNLVTLSAGLSKSRQKYNPDNNYNESLKQLINEASLASTEAKLTKRKFVKYQSMGHGDRYLVPKI